MSYSYDANTKSLTWNYPEPRGRWIFAGIALFAFLGINLEIFSSVFAPAVVEGIAEHGQSFGGPADVNLWLNIGGMIVSAGLFLVLLRPPVSGSFLAGDSRFEYDSGRRSADLLGYISGYFEGFPNLQRFLKMAMGSVGESRFLPSRTRLTGELLEISDLALRTGSQGSRLMFRFRGKEYEFASGLYANDLNELCALLVETFPTMKRGERDQSPSNP